MQCAAGQGAAEAPLVAGELVDAPDVLAAFVEPNRAAEPLEGHLRGGRVA